MTPSSLGETDVSHGSLCPTLNTEVWLLSVMTTWRVLCEGGAELLRLYQVAGFKF
jgi:hypothetical protein